MANLRYEDFEDDDFDSFQKFGKRPRMRETRKVRKPSQEAIDAKRRARANEREQMIEESEDVDFK